VQEVIRIEDQHYILATSSRAVERAHVLKDGDTFAAFGRDGDIRAIGLSQQGLFHDGTRHLSRFELRVNGVRPLLLSSRTREDNNVFGADMTNADVMSGERVVLPRDMLHLFRARFLWSGTCCERLRTCNYGREAVSLARTYDIGADFVDIFEVRGTPRNHRGELLEPRIEPQAVELAYRGLDGLVRLTRFGWTHPDTAASDSQIHFHVLLPPQEAVTIDLTIACAQGSRPRSRARHDAALAALVRRDQQEQSQYCAIEASDPLFNQWLHRSAADVRMMTTETATGLYPYAGVPWFNTAFGRDGLITALAVLWANPAMGAGVLRFLAATQATAVEPEQDAEPGKILHEMRGGEMAILGEVPFRRYYGSVDATPLFVLLAGEYYRRTQDRALIESIWPNLDAALRWIDDYGDADGDGFVEYARHSRNGLVQQGWKDSQDSVFHADGRLADPAIALCEVQSYVYAAKRHGADLAALLGHQARAEELRAAADRLRDRFERAFWCEDLGVYAIALDGAKRRCEVLSSHAGHALLTDLAHPDRARRVADTLLAPESFSGWGIRTLASSSVRYNPMSYHNGSIWPHDNALIAAGCARYGFSDCVDRLLTSLFEASLFLDLLRLPELFCGFHRRPQEGPTLYPVACSPQAWASASAFLLLQSCLGLSIDAAENRVSVTRPRLPATVNQITIRNLIVRAGDRIDLEFTRQGPDVGLSVLRRDADIRVSIVK
jgi:glycogen debranching enzyme